MAFCGVITARRGEGPLSHLQTANSGLRERYETPLFVYQIINKRLFRRNYESELAVHSIATLRVQFVDLLRWNGVQRQPFNVTFSGCIQHSTSRASTNWTKSIADTNYQVVKITDSLCISISVNCFLVQSTDRAELRSADARPNHRHHSWLHWLRIGFSSELAESARRNKRKGIRGTESWRR